jgi:hypothetical protein
MTEPEVTGSAGRATPTVRAANEALLGTRSRGSWGGSIPA